MYNRSVSMAYSFELRVNFHLNKALTMSPIESHKSRESLEMKLRVQVGLITDDKNNHLI